MKGKTCDPKLMAGAAKTRAAELGKRYDRMAALKKMSAKKKAA